MKVMELVMFLFLIDFCILGLSIYTFGGNKYIVEEYNKKKKLYESWTLDDCIRWQNHLGANSSFGFGRDEVLAQVIHEKMLSDIQSRASENNG
jgi:hypothetical protein